MTPLPLKCTKHAISMYFFHENFLQLHREDPRLQSKQGNRDRCKHSDVHNHYSKSNQNFASGPFMTCQQAWINSGVGSLRNFLFFSHRSAKTTFLQQKVPYLIVLPF